MVSSYAPCREQIPYSLWIAIQRMPRMIAWGFCRLQFVSLLLTRSYQGLIYALNWWDVIDEHFYLGGALMFDDIQRLKRQGIGAVVNLCAERHDNRERLNAASMAYLWLPVIDMCAPTLDQIEHALDWVDHQFLVGHKIYIHCAAGVGRSATFLACWYIHQGMTVSQALQLIKRRHPQVGLTRRQERRLYQFATRRKTLRLNA